MRVNKTSNTIYNIVVNFINRILMVFLPFVCRTVIIKKLGIEYLGLSSLLSSLLNVLSLAELGIGTAMVFSMYEPIAKDDNEEICALLSLYRLYYRGIGFFITVAGIILMPFVPLLVKNDVPVGIDIYIVFGMYLINTVLSYFLFEYRAALFIAFQKEYKINIFKTLIKGIGYCLEISVILLFSNYYIYLMIIPVVTVCTNFVVLFEAKKVYPQYIPNGKISEKSVKKLRKSTIGIFVGKVNDVARNSFDSIILSAFLGLSTVAIYNNYYYIITTLSSFLIIIHGAMVSGVGNGIILESIEKNYREFNMFLFIYMWISGWCTCCVVCLIRPFMILWVGIDNSYGGLMSCLFGIYFYVLKMGDILSVYKTAKGIWWEERWKTICESILNILLNVLMVKVLGIYGVVIATIIAVTFVNFPWGSYIGFKHCFYGFSIKKYYEKQIAYAVCTTVVCGVTFFVSSFLDDCDFIMLIVKIIICIIVPNISFWIIYRKTNIYNDTCFWIKMKVTNYNNQKLGKKNLP